MSAASACTAARSAMLVGEFDHARRTLDDALADDLDPADRLDVLCARARLSVLLGDGAETLPMLERAAAGAEATLPVHAGRLLLDVVILKLYAAQQDAVSLATRARTLTAGADPATRARADTVMGLAHAFAGETDDANAYLLRGADLVRVGGAPDEVAFLLQQVVVGLASSEQYAEGLVVARRYLRAVRSVGAEGMLPTVLCYLANSAYFTGDLDEMEMAGTEAMDLAAASGQPAMAAYGLACRALVGALRGDPDAPAELEASVGQLVAHGAERIQTLPLMALGLAALGRGDWPEAAERYRAVRDFMAHSPTVPGLLHWRGDEVEALWLAGHTDEARAALAELTAVADGHGPWERAAAARASAMLATDTATAEASFREALRLHGESTSPLERARTELCLAEWLVEQERPDEARGLAEAARATFHALETSGWRDRSQTLLDRLDGSPLSAVARTTAIPRVRAFGPLTVIRAGAETRVGFDTRGRLLRCLAAAGGAVHTEQLIDTMWPEATVETGSARLRTVLARVRKTYGPVVVREGSVLRWADDVDVDVDRFRELSRRAVALRSGSEAAAAATEAIELYRDDLLPLERYAADVATARERLRQRYLVMLDLLAEHEMSSGRPDRAAEHLRTAIDAEPLDEARYVRLAALLLDQGRLAQAQRVLAAATRTIAELGLTVSPQLVALERRLEQPAPD